jgi:hypothetical protein
VLAQNIPGRVEDASTKQGLLQASVYLSSDRKAGTTTDQKGSFELSLPTGATGGKLVVSFTGYVQQAITIDRSNTYYSIATRTGCNKSSGSGGRFGHTQRSIEA